MVQVSQPYMTTCKITALTLHTFVGKVMSLLFHILTVDLMLYLHVEERGTSGVSASS